MLPPPERSYAQYEQLEPDLASAKDYIENGDYEQATEVLASLCKQAMSMWLPAGRFPALPIQVSYLCELKSDVENNRTYPPYGNFALRLEQFS